MNRVGTLVGPIGWRSPRAPGQRRLHRQRVADHRQVLVDCRLRHAVARQPVANPFAVIGKQTRTGAGIEQLVMMARAMRLLRVRLHRARKRRRMWPRQHG
jgi:hypothetical protein